MTILALDLGTDLGWATDTKGPITYGSVSFKNKRFEGGGMRYLRFRQWLDQMKALLGQIDAVYFEEVRRHAGTDAAHVYGGLMGHLTAWCEEQVPKIPYQGVPVGEIKKSATGKGNANKDTMIAAMKGRGYEPQTDDEADAIALLLLKGNPCF